MNQYKWHSGPPPHIGWWNASFYFNDPDSWRWWDGLNWSCAAYKTLSASAASGLAATQLNPPDVIYWRHYYPKNACVARINPNETAH